MALAFFCDGCGAKLEQDDLPLPRGLLKRLYCEVCKPKAEAFMASLDTLHTDVATTFAERMAALKEEYAKELKAFPDE